VTQFTWDAASNGTVNGTFNVRIIGSVTFDVGAPVAPVAPVKPQAPVSEGGAHGTSKTR
jgi:hypothetical protein